MGSLISGALSAVTGALSGVWGYVAAAGIAAILAASGAWYVVHRMDESTIADMKTADAVAGQNALKAALAKQRQIDAKNQDAAYAEALAQQKIVTQTVTITKEIPTYVHDAISCPGPTVGLARVLRAAALGVEPSSLDAPVGQSSDACSDVTPSEVAGWFKDYAAASRANAEQLDALIASVKANAAIAQGEK
jgi:hypothetical protein